MTDPHEPAPHTPATDAIYSDIPEIEQRLLNVLPNVLNAGFILEDTRPIPYGVRLRFRTGDTTVGLAVYHSKKKGHSTVFDPGGLEGPVKQLRLLMESGAEAGFISPIPAEQAFATWVGCDEGGKGAFTGPLVAVAYLCDQKNARELFDLGVRDSKAVDPRNLRKLMTTIIRRFSRRISVMELKPETYNRLYADFKAQNKSLNHLLAWAHGKAVEKFIPAHPDAVIVDQFAYPALIRSRIPTGPKLIVRTKAEDNIAVAAASIIAAGRYLVALDAMSQELGVDIRPGAGVDTDRSVREAVAKHGPAILPRIVKTHFRNMQKL